MNCYNTQRAISSKCRTDIVAIMHVLISIICAHEALQDNGLWLVTILPLHSAIVSMLGVCYCCCCWCCCYFNVVGFFFWCIFTRVFVFILVLICAFSCGRMLCVVFFPDEYNTCICNHQHDTNTEWYELFFVVFCVCFVFHFFGSSRNTKLNFSCVCYVVFVRSCRSCRT